MALKVLLADDSVPAQNMGKKILTDAGYEVLAVSNGLEALKKIADSVPDIAILDIFMPGYTGLEVCSRLRGNAVTAELPVILTVGKLEPYRPEDGEKVHSNAVIVKPFASNELVSAVRSLVGLPFAIRREVPEVKPAAPEPVSQPVPEDDYEEEAPMLAGIGFDRFPSAPAASPQQANFGLAGDPAGVLGWDPDAKPTRFSASAMEESPATPAKVAINPAFEAASAVDAPAAASVLTDFEMEPQTAAAASNTGTATALVEWWQPTPEPAEQTDDVELEFAPGFEPPVFAANSDLTPPTASEILTAQETLAQPSPAEAGDDTLNPSTPTAGALATPDEIREEARKQAASEAPVLDRESRMQAFEALFSSEEAIPLEANPAALPDLLAQEELEALREDESQTVPPIALQESTNEPLHITDATSSATQGLEIGAGADAGELQLDSDSVPNWLSTGDLPHLPELPVAAAPQQANQTLPPQKANDGPSGNPALAGDPGSNPALENSPAQPAPAAASFYSGVPEVAHGGEPAEDLPGTATEATPPMVCYLPKGPVAESTRESSISSSLEPAATEFDCAETMTPQSEAGHIEDEHVEAHEFKASAPSEPLPKSPEVLASGALEQVASELLAQHANNGRAGGPAVQPEAQAEQRGDESVGECENVSAAAHPPDDAKRIHQAVESVFDRFRPLLIAAIARELTKRT